jgi:hypothetical protein
LPRLTSLGLSQLALSPAALTSIAGLPRLRELWLAHCGLGVDVLPVLAGMRGLRKLDLRGNAITAHQARRALPGVELEK